MCAPICPNKLVGLFFTELCLCNCGLPCRKILMGCLLSSLSRVCPLPHPLQTLNKSFPKWETAIKSETLWKTTPPIYWEKLEHARAHSLPLTTCLITDCLSLSNVIGCGSRPQLRQSASFLFLPLPPVNVIWALTSVSSFHQMYHLRTYSVGWLTPCKAFKNGVSTSSNALESPG